MMRTAVVALAASLLLTMPASPQDVGDRDAFIAGTTNDCPGCDLTGVRMKGRNLAGANLAGADLTRAVLHRANLSKANLAGAKLGGVNLNLADLRFADFTAADLERALIYGVQAGGSNFTDAKLDATREQTAHFQ